MSGLPESGHDLQPRHEPVDRVFGDGHAAAHPELVVAIVHAASSDWAARVITAGLASARWSESKTRAAVHKQR
jgi:hypothetical protein